MSLGSTLVLFSKEKDGSTSWIARATAVWRRESMSKRASSTVNRNIATVKYRTSSKFFIRNLISFEVYTESEKVAMAMERTKRFIALLITLVAGFIFYLLISGRYSLEYKDSLKVKPSLDEEFRKLLKEARK